MNTLLRERRLLSATEVSARTRLSIRTLERLRVAGTGPAFQKIGTRRVGYWSDVVDAWIDSGTFTSTSEYAR
jgi:predicted DNA-binding transcriptional regulator AlpA